MHYKRYRIYLSALYKGGNLKRITADITSDPCAVWITPRNGTTVANIRRCKMVYGTEKLIIHAESQWFCRDSDLNSNVFK